MLHESNLCSFPSSYPQLFNSTLRAVSKTPDSLPQLGNHILKWRIARLALDLSGCAQEAAALANDMAAWMQSELSSFRETDESWQLWLGMGCSSWSLGPKCGDPPSRHMESALGPLHSCMALPGGRGEVCRGDAARRPACEVSGAGILSLVTSFFTLVQRQGFM